MTSVIKRQYVYPSMGEKTTFTVPVYSNDYGACIIGGIVGGYGSLIAGIQYNMGHITAINLMDGSDLSSYLTVTVSNNMMTVQTQYSSILTMFPL